MDEHIQMQQQIDEINRKLDQLLTHANEQKLKQSAMQDLSSDLSIIGKDLYDTAVAELENHSVELDPEEVKLLLIKLLKNIPNLTQLLNMIESLTDLAKDAGPMMNEVIIDFTKKMHVFETRGYFDFFTKGSKLTDDMVKAFNTLHDKDIDSYSFGRLLKELRSREVRKGLMLLVMFLKYTVQSSEQQAEKAASE